MSERLKAAIEEIEAQIKAKEAEIINPLKITVNHLCQLIGEAARYEIDGSGASGQPKRNILNWRKDQFYGRPLAQCVTEYLEARETAGLDRSATVDDIYDALSKGGYKSEGTSGSDENAKRAIKISLTKNTAQFSKIGDELFGLKKWYPNAKTQRKSNGSGNGAEAEEKTETEATSEEATVPPSTPQT
jgi:hypothetical protein